jgi:hypothetical protein
VIKAVFVDRLNIIANQNFAAISRIAKNRMMIQINQQTVELAEMRIPWSKRNGTRAITRKTSCRHFLDRCGNANSLQPIAADKRIRLNLPQLRARFKRDVRQWDRVECRSRNPVAKTIPAQNFNRGRDVNRV